MVPRSTRRPDGSPSASSPAPAVPAQAAVAAPMSVRRPLPRQRRDRGGGSVVARQKAGGATVYDAFSTFADPVTGESRRSCKRGFLTSAAATKYLRAQTSQVDAGSYVPPTRLTLEQYLGQCLDALRLAPQTVGNYRVWVHTRGLHQEAVHGSRTVSSGAGMSVPSRSVDRGPRRGA